MWRRALSLSPTPISLGRTVEPGLGRLDQRCLNFAGGGKAGTQGKLLLYPSPGLERKEKQSRESLGEQPAGQVAAARNRASFSLAHVACVSLSTFSVTSGERGGALCDFSLSPREGNERRGTFPKPTSTKQLSLPCRVLNPGPHWNHPRPCSNTD